ncbi:TPA: pyrroline-5-carboxylate reductase [bacterium]|nr:pyrroline-5-carboxylate reductase [bacterium]
MKIGVIGSGNMGSAIVDGLLKEGYDVIASDIVEEKLSVLKCKTTRDNLDILKSVDTVILAVKPQVIKGVLEEIKEEVKSHLIISIAGGIKIEAIEEILGNKRVIRVMPNTPSLIGKGISAIAKGKYASDSDMDKANEIFSAIGDVVTVDESLMDSITALSGSGPAYVFLFIDALISVGVRMGLSRDVSEKLVLSTISGSIALLKETGKHPLVLRDMVTSPGGTTVAAIEVMEKKNFSGIIWEAILSAEKRAKELGK